MSSRHRDPARWLPPSAAQPPADGAVPVSAAVVVRTDVAQRQAVTGTLSYQGAYSVVNELAAGVLTSLPHPGQVVTRGHALYRLADQAAVLLYGPVPAWRDIGS